MAELIEPLCTTLGISFGIDHWCERNNSPKEHFGPGNIYGIRETYNRLMFIFTALPISKSTCIHGKRLGTLVDAQGVFQILSFQKPVLLTK